MKRTLHQRLALLTLAIALTAVPSAAQLRIAVAASAGGLVDSLSGEYHRVTGVAIETVTGSSGLLSAQILQGAPYDIFFSADTAYPGRIERAGLSRSPVRVYALGTVGLVSRVRPDPASPLRVLLGDGIRRVAVANPELAPYGRAAIDILSRAGILESVRPKLIYAESITHVNHFITTGAVDAALTVPASLRPAGPDGTAGSGWYTAALGTHGIPQGVVLIGRDPAAPKAPAAKFLEFVLSPAGREVVASAGYGLP